MPGTDGFQATTCIRRAEAAQDHRTAIVALTADALIGTRERCILSGMDDYVTKPITVEALRRVLERWAASPAVVRPEPNTQ
jgi:CheY-like chemotaxis protein